MPKITTKGERGKGITKATGTEERASAPWQVVWKAGSSEPGTAWQGDEGASTRFFGRLLRGRRTQQAEAPEGGNQVLYSGCTPDEAQLGQLSFVQQSLETRTVDIVGGADLPTEIVTLENQVTDGGWIGIRLAEKVLELLFHRTELFPQGLHSSAPVRQQRVPLVHLVLRQLQRPDDGLVLHGHDAGDVRFLLGHGRENHHDREKSQHSTFHLEPPVFAPADGACFRGLDDAQTRRVDRAAPAGMTGVHR